MNNQQAIDAVTRWQRSHQQKKRTDGLERQLVMSF